MFYEADRRREALAHDPFKALVAPRPIGWISSVSATGAVNLAPYSFFNGFSTDPGIVGFSTYGYKDSIAFVEETGEFTCSLVSWDQRDGMNQTSAPLPRGESEFAFAGLEMEPAALVKPPRVKGAPAALECRYLRTIRLDDLNGADTGWRLVLGQVVGVHIDDRYLLEGGRVDTAAMKLLARLGFRDYAVVTEVFSMKRPEGGGD
ncbi:flavin reductase family protein [Camelimonas abortus]|uniref:Flavin reductase family protein n=1 Tax=Camelimonas abortus TaxID=1017184 RepID=A0ABV7LG04_9HYPH